MIATVKGMLSTYDDPVALAALQAPRTAAPSEKHPDPLVQIAPPMGEPTPAHAAPQETR